MHKPHPRITRSPCGYSAKSYAARGLTPSPAAQRRRVSSRRPAVTVSWDLARVVWLWYMFGMGRRPVPWERALVVLADYPALLYFRDRWGQWWRVYDKERGKRPQCPPLPSAAYRYFISTEGRRFRYTFADGEDHAVSPRLLTRQRTEAELLITRRRGAQVPARRADD